MAFRREQGRIVATPRCATSRDGTTRPGAGGCVAATAGPASCHSESHALPHVEEDIAALDLRSPPTKSRHAGSRLAAAEKSHIAGYAVTARDLNKRNSKAARTP